ncbi:polyprotein [Glycine soja]
MFLWNQMRAKILENIIIMSRLLRSFSRISFRSNSSLSSSSRNSNLLNDQDNQTQEVAPKHNLFDEENIPEIPQDQLYVPETIKDKHNFDYIIKTVENNIPLGQEVGEEFHLLSKNSIYEHSRKYKYLHIGCVQVAIKPLIDMGIDAAVLMCLRDIRHNQFEDSLIGTVETSLGQGPIYFNCYPNKTVSLMDRNILDSLFLNIHFHGLDIKEGSIPTALIYRIQYKVMNTCASRVLLKPQRGETTLFITDMTKANVSLPRKIKWDEVTLPERWVMDKATPSIPRPAPTIEHIKQDNSGKVEITFNRRNSFSSRIEASRSEYESARRKDFYSPENEPQRRCFFQHYKGTNRKQIQDKFYEFVERVKINVLFFDWFHAYAIRKDINYPWKQEIIGDPTTNVITNWQVRDGELIQSELPPTTQYQLPNIKDSNNKPVMAIPFKTKDVNEEVTSKDIKSLMEQANYTNKYLQALGETIKTKVVPKQKSIEGASPSVPIEIEKPLFKPFKVSEKAKRKIRELRKTKSLTEGVGDNHSELLNKIGSLLKVIPDTPQASENTSKMVTRSTSKLINVINEDSDQNSDNTTEIGSVSKKSINPINSKNWRTPSKLYYQRPTAPDLLLEERGENNFKSFSANNIYEWNIDAQTEYNIMNTLQHMTMVATAYQTSHECSEETIIDILVAGFSGQLKGWWDNYLTNEEKSKIYSAVKTDLNGKVITNDDDKEIPDAVNTLIFTIAQHFIGDPSLWKDRSAKLLSNLKCRTLADFRWYRDTFLTRVYTREDSQQPFWKEKFLAGLPRSLGDKVRDKIRSQSANGDIPYENLSYGQLISYVQKVALKIFQDDKIQRQLAKEKAQTKRDLGSFCEQFGLPACPKQKKKQTSRKEAHDHKPANNRRFPKRRYSQKPSTSHISKYCRLKKKLRNLNLEPSIEEQINNLLIEISEEETETETSSSVLSDENLNLIQQDDQLSSIDDDGQVNTLTREQDLLFEAINSIPDPQEKKVFLEKLKKTLEVKPRQRDFITNNKFDVKPITKKATTTSSGSPTQTGSSTQKGKLEGSLTQTTTVKSESSTQESPKPTTTKQTTHLLLEVASPLSLPSPFRCHLSSKKQRNPLMKKILGLQAPMELASCEGQPLMVKEVSVSSKRLAKTERHFEIKTNIKEISLLRQPPHFLLCKKTLVSIATSLRLEFIPQVKELLDEGLIHKSLNPCALLVPKIGIIRHQIPKIGGMMNALGSATLICKITRAPNIFMICVHRDSLGSFNTNLGTRMGHLRFVILFGRNNQHENTEKGVPMNPKRIKVIPEWPAPPSVRKIWGFQDLTNFYKRFAPYFSIFVAPLIELVRNHVPSWEDAPEMSVKGRSPEYQEPQDLRDAREGPRVLMSLRTHLLLEVASPLSLPSPFRCHLSSKKQRNPLMKKILGLQAPMELASEMASESDDDSETDLQKQIQKAKQTKTVCNQKPSQSLTQQESTPQPGNSYISKNKFFNVLQMEPEYWDKNPFKATAKGFHYRPIAANKTRKFYEFILIDTNSVSIKHFKDPKDPNLNTHSTIQILKVMQQRHYGSNLNQPKKFSAPFDPAGYNYWDYVDAWTNVFWHQNSKFKHSLLIYFKNNTAYNFPNWFLQWWNYFGPIPQIFPEEVQQGFEQFNKLYNSKESRIPADLKYFSSFALSWIFSWQYIYGKTENNKQYPPLQRHAFVKWWSQFDTSKAAPDQVKNWFQSNPEFLKPADPETSLFLNQKSQLAAFLASAKSKESLAQNLKEVLQLLQQEVEEEPSKKETESSETNDDQEDDPFYQNEDDCFGISLDDD